METELILGSPEPGAVTNAAIESMDSTTMEQAQLLKEEGNLLFKAGKYEDALSKYTAALKLNPGAGAETAVYLKNKAACNLKLEKYSEAASDCSDALEILPNDPKALFRRCQAFEQMDRPEEAYKDVVQLMRLDPKNTAIQPILRRLTPVVQKKVNEQTSTDSKVSQMFELTFNVTGDPEKRKQAATNLIVLAREDAGAEKICQSDGIAQLVRLLESEREKELKLTAIRVMACLAQDSKRRAKAVLSQLSLKLICLYMSNESEEISASMAHVLQNILNSVTDLEQIKKDREKFERERKADSGSKLRPWHFTHDRIADDGIAVADEVFPALIFMLNQAKVSAYGRDNAMELIIKFVTMKDGVGWSVKFVAAGGIQKLLEVAGTIPEHKTIPSTANSRMHASLTLNTIYDDLLSDKARAQFVDAVNDYFQDMFGDNIMESKLEAVMALAALLQGPSEVGNTILGRQGVLEMMLAMADSENALHVKYAVEALVHSASKKDKCSGVIKPATPILKKLYQSPNDTIKVRALVGLCKLGSFGGTDTSAKSFADGSTLTLSKACRRFLCNKSKDVDLRKWAAEGMAYLTLDADVKEDLADDAESLKSLIDLAKHPDKAILYPVAQVFVNITNSYDKPEAEPELIDLAKFAKQHVPEDHPKDREPYISQRRKKLVAAGVVNALVAFKTESDSSKELLSRVYLAVCWDENHRGLVIQQGGAKALIPLANEGTDIGRAIAAQALAKIAITNNPAIAFPGQRVCEVVRPLLQLLDLEKAAIQNFEALMALTNLTSMNDTIRQRVLKEKGFPLIEHYCFEKHEQLRRAAMECMCNLIMHEKVVDMFKGENDRVKLFVLYCGEEEDPQLIRAASGGLAMLSHDREICHKVVESTQQWFRILQELAVSEIPDIQYRGTYILANLMAADKEIATKLVQSSMFEILMALTTLQEPEKQQAKESAEVALEEAVKWGLIKHTADGGKPVVIKAKNVPKLEASSSAADTKDEADASEDAADTKDAVKDGVPEAEDAAKENAEKAETVTEDDAEASSKAADAKDKAAATTKAEDATKDKSDVSTKAEDTAKAELEEAAREDGAKLENDDTHQGVVSEMEKS